MLLLAKPGVAGCLAMTGSALGSYCTCKSDVASYSNLRILFWNATCIIGAAVIRGAQHDDTHVGLVQQSLSGTMCATHARVSSACCTPTPAHKQGSGFWAINVANMLSAPS
jgi:hypothetical protein